jgi:hypothetical protein
MLSQLSYFGVLCYFTNYGAKYGSRTRVSSLEDCGPSLWTNFAKVLAPKEKGSRLADVPNRLPSKKATYMWSSRLYGSGPIFMDAAYRGHINALRLIGCECGSAFHEFELS